MIANKESAHINWFDHRVGTSADWLLSFTLQATFGSLPSHAGLVNEATKLNKEAKDLKTKAVDVAWNFEFELDDARGLEVDAEQVRSDDC